MQRAIQILVTSTDETDLDWLRERCVARVEEEVEEHESRMDGEVSVDWEWIDVKD